MREAFAKCCVGKSMPPEHYQKMGDALRDIPRSQEVKDKISKANTGEKRSESAKIKKSKSWNVIFPDGTTQSIVNLRKFCKENGLNDGAMNNVANGKAKHHKKFRCSYKIS